MRKILQSEQTLQSLPLHVKRWGVHGPEDGVGDMQSWRVAPETTRCSTMTRKRMSCPAKRNFHGPRTSPRSPRWRQMWMWQETWRARWRRSACRAQNSRAQRYHSCSLWAGQGMFRESLEIQTQDQRASRRGTRKLKPK